MLELDKTIEYLNQGWVGSLLGVAGIVIGALISYWFFKRGEKFAAPSIAQSEFLVVGAPYRKVDGLEVKATFHGREVTRLTRSEIRFWNAGNQTLEGSSIAEREPLRLELNPGEEFLSARVMHCTRDVTGFRIEIDNEMPNKLFMNFDFFDGGDGAVIECYHNGQQVRPEIKGVFKGIPNGIESKQSAEPWGTDLHQQGANNARNFGLIMLIVAAFLKWNDYTGWWPFGLAIVPLLSSIVSRAPYPDSLHARAFKAENDQNR